MDLKFISRRSPLLCLHGCVASSSPLASEVGIKILKAGGNAADAAVAVAAALNVVEPCSTGIGGDCFCLFYDAKKKAVHGLNGSGRSPGGVSLDLLSDQGFTELHPPPPTHAHHVTIPGAAAGWVDTVEKFGSGKLSMLEILKPAIELAEKGFPVGPVVSVQWKRGLSQILRDSNPHGRDMLYDGTRAPHPGEIMHMPHLANTFKVLGTEGKSSFYRGRIARSIVDVVQSNGGTLRLEDLASHFTTYDDPVKVNYRGVDVWEMPPNGQGLTALMALNILSGYDFSCISYGSKEYWHLVIEALRLSFADTKWYISDPAKVSCPVEQLLSRDYADGRRQLIQPNKAMKLCDRGTPFSSTDTVYFSVADVEGNACSFINSNYMGFGTGLVPEGCGFTLQNRGANFSLNPLHPNVLGPAKRPYHTIIPGMATHSDSGELYASFGVMGGFMQPQGHVQVLLNMIDYGMDPQLALDAPRVCIGQAHTPTGPECVSLEDGIHDDVKVGLQAMGHEVQGPLVGYQRTLFGRGQIIQSRITSTNTGPCRVWWAGSEGRTDGMAIGY